MARFSLARHKLQVTALMTVYALLMLFEWPRVASAHDVAVRVLLALLPAVPVVGVIVLMARRVMRGDELEQRIHLLALSVAVGVVSAASVVGAFLVAAGVWHVDGGILFWVFPALMLAYGLARVVLMRRFSGTWNLWACR